MPKIILACLSRNRFNTWIQTRSMHSERVTDAFSSDCHRLKKWRRSKKHRTITATSAGSAVRTTSTKSSRSLSNQPGKTHRVSVFSESLKQVLMAVRQSLGRVIQSICLIFYKSILINEMISSSSKTVSFPRRRF